MDLAGTFVREIITIAGYVMVFAAVCKLFQIATDLGEIKDLLKRRYPVVSPARGVDELAGEEAYAERLLKSIPPGSRRDAAEHEVVAPR